MPQRFQRLRIQSAVAVAVLLLGAAVLTLAVADEEDLPFLSALPWVEADPFEGLEEVIRLHLVTDSIGFALANGDRHSLHPQVRPFYESRAFAPAWVDSTAHDTLIAAFRGVADVGLDPEAYLASALNRSPGAVVADSVASLVDQDLLLTSAVFRLADDLAGPQVDVDSLYGALWFAAPRRVMRVDTLLARALAVEAPADAVAQVLERMHPQHAEYRALRRMVATQRTLIERETWPTIPAGRDVAPGDNAPIVPVLRERMQLEEAIQPTSTPVNPLAYDDGLVEQVKRFQANRGLPDDGVITTATRSALNERPSSDIIPLLLLNLERWRWLPDELGDLHVVVNIPSYELAVRERAGTGFVERFRMNTVIGKRAWETPVFSDTMTQIVFNPTWTIPASIQMESYGRVRPGGMVRDPGPGNPMGRVKFLFPNDHAIYIHDTPSRWAFSQNQRAFSHGCLRAQDPKGLAREILTRTNGWTEEAVNSKFDGPWQLQDVPLERPVPVHLVYFTAWIDEAGRLQTFGDVYGHDAKLADALGLQLEARA